MNDIKRGKKNWRDKKSTFYLCISEQDKIPFICEKDGKFPIDKYKAYYCSGGEWYTVSSENPSAERIVVFFNAKCQKVALETRDGDTLSIDIFVCGWHEQISDNNKILLLQRIAEGEDQFDVFYVDFFGLDAMNIRLLRMLEKDIIPKIVSSHIPEINSFLPCFNKNETLGQ